MIRDPSDGSIKEISPTANEINAVGAKTAPEEITSGLREQNQNSDYLARLQRSREWLADRKTAQIVNHLIGEKNCG